MKKGVSIWSFPPGGSVRDCMKQAKKEGFEGIELSLDEVGEISMKSAPADMAAFRKAAAEEGVEIVGLATGLYWAYSHASADPKIREAAEKVTLKQIELAAALGTDSILVVPGSVGADFIPDCEVIPYDEAYSRGLAAMRKLAPAAEAQGVTMALENVWNKFLTSPLEFAKFIDETESASVGSYFDVGNTVASGYPEHWIRILGKRIKRVHFKDFRRAVGTVDGFVDLLAGDVNFPAVMSELKNAGYDGFVTAEMVPPAPFYRYHSDQIIHNTSQAMNRILGRQTC